MVSFALATLLTSVALIQTPAPESKFILTPEVRKTTLSSLYSALEDRYVDEQIGKQIAAELRKRDTNGEFDKLQGGQEFAARVNDLMKAMVTDAHLRFRFSERPLPKRERPSEPSPEELERQREETRFVNAGFQKVERLRGNVGYIKFDYFDEHANLKRPLAAAMTFLANTDALIIDLRENGGGSPAGVQMVCSYLFGETPVHLNSLYFREGNRTEKFMTLKSLDAPRYLDREVYVLTSKRTGSGAEECSYNLKNLKRATIVGSSTWGGANPGGVVRLSDHFSCFIPVGKAINPITNTNWEGVGVAPDVAVEPERALVTAQLLAIKSLIDSAKNPSRKSDLQAIFREVEAGKQ